MTSQYPALSHTFIQREVLALRERGTFVETFSIRRPCSTAPRSEIDKIEYADTFYVLPPQPLRLLRAHLSALANRPRRYLAALFHALTVRPPGLRSLIWHFFYFVEAVSVWHEMRRRGAKHVHVHFAMSCATVAMIAAQLGECTFSMTVHGPAVFYDPTRYLLREKVRRAVMVSCISDFCRSQVMALTRPEDWPKLKVVHCGVDPACYAPRKRLAQPESGTIRLFNVARLCPPKAHSILLQAVAELRRNQCDAVCTIVGDGPERPHLELLCRELGIEEQVRFAGSVDQDAIQKFYDDADIFVLPSFAEGVPVVLMEAMAKELPVVATQIMGIPELVEHGHTGLLVPPGRVRPLAEAIVTLAQDSALRREMGARGRKKVCREFDIGLAAQQLSQVFSEIAPDTPAGKRPGLRDIPTNVAGRKHRGAKRSA